MQKNSPEMNVSVRDPTAVKISVYNETEQDTTSPTHQVTLHEAWPKTISAIELGWESAELVDFTIDIGYSWWTDGSS